VKIRVEADRRLRVCRMEPDDLVSMSEIAEQARETVILNRELESACRIRFQLDAGAKG